MNYDDFVSRIWDYTKRHLSDKYDTHDIEFFDATINPAHPEWHATFSRYDRKHDCKVFTVQILFTGDEFEVNEVFGDWDFVPKSYNLAPRQDMPEQTPMFIYGTFRRLGDALNSIRQHGDSLDGRKYKSLYW